MIGPDDLESIYFSALKGSAYHSMRAAFYQRIRISFVFWTFVIGLISITLASNIFPINFYPFNALSLGQMAFLLSCFSFVISFLGFALNFSGKIFFHEALSNRWKDLIRIVDDKRGEGKNIRTKDYSFFIKEYNLIARDEPFIIRGLEAIAYNQVCRRHYAGADLIPISLRIRLFKNWSDFPNTKFAPVPQPKTKKSDSKGK